MDFPITLDSQSTHPLHRQLYDEIRRSILSGRLARGQRVPSTRSLSESLGISRATVTLSYETLLSEGYLEALTGSGTYVCRRLPEEMLRAKNPAGKAKVTSPKGPSKATNYKKLSKYGGHLRDKPWFSYGGDEPEIQFSFGRPAYDQFPIREWQQLYNIHLKQFKLSDLDCPSNAAGYRPLREAIANYLSRARAVTCSADQIIIVNGSQQAIDIVTRVIVDRGDSVGIEEPGYIGARKAFEVQGAQLIPLRVDKEGLVVSNLHSMANLKLVYVTPSHQFPTGVVLSLARRLELLNWAEKTGTFVIEDDYDSEYRYKGRPIPALAGLEHHDTVIYIGTFSKVLFPSLRLGYLVVPPALVDVFTRAKWLSDRHTPLLEQQVLTDFINQGHLERHIRRMRNLYEEKRKGVVTALQAAFGNTISILGDNAGINVLVRIESENSDEEVVARAKALGVGIVSTKNFYVNEGTKGEFLLNYGSLSEEALHMGIERLKRAISAETVSGL
jgi:GntR family transcriptional regulator/MocR family aminotransferase